MREKITVNGDDFTTERIQDSTYVLKESLIGDELQQDEVNAKLDLTSLVPTIFCPAGTDGLLTSDEKVLGVRPWVRLLTNDPTAYTYGVPVLCYWKGELLGKFYMTSILRVGKALWQITAVSAVGLLGKQRHYGGIYRGETFEAVAAEIIGGAVPYTIDDILKNQAVYGYIPVATRRDNLHQLLFAMGASIRKDSGGDIFITALKDDTASEIPDKRIFEGGSVKHTSVSAKVIVHEHTFNAYDTDEEVKLYDGEVSAEEITSPMGETVTGSIVLFSEPMHDLTVESGTILESGVNYAVLAPGGGVVLRGKKYAHTMRAVVRPSTASAEVTENAHVVEKATLVSLLNSEAVADRLYSYYTSAETIETDILVEGERPGDSVTFNDPFDSPAAGLITSMVMSPSGILRAQVEIVSGFSPNADPGNAYDSLATFTEDGTWVAPVTGKARLVLIGGGDGGWSGGDGEAGAYSEGQGYGPAGKAGVAGLYGNGGKILVATADVVEGEEYPITIGKGGAGAENNGVESVQGGLGTPTTFGELYTSALGAPSSSGYTELFTGSIYGKRGKSGIAGGKGGDPDTPFGTKVIGTDGVEYKAPRKRDDLNSSGAGGSESGAVFSKTRWTNEAPALYVDADYVASNGYLTVTVNVYPTTGTQEFGFDINAQVFIDGVSVGTKQLKAASPNKWSDMLSASFSRAVSGSTASVDVQVYSTGGDMRDETYSGYASLPQNRTTLNAGGYGGGAAANANGGEAGGSIPYGGDGASATVDGANATTPGEGGHGGHGGGSGGAGGYIHEQIENYGGNTSNFRGGFGGKGSNGGDGMDGIALIYYQGGVSE